MPNPSIFGYYSKKYNNLTCYRAVACTPKYHPSPDPYCEYDESIDGDYHGFRCYFRDYDYFMFTPVYHAVADKTDYYYKMTCDNINYSSIDSRNNDSNPIEVTLAISSYYRIYIAKCGVTEPTERLISAKDGWSSEYPMWSGDAGEYPLANSAKDGYINFYANHDFSHGHLGTHCGFISPAYLKDPSKPVRIVNNPNYEIQGGYFCNRETNDVLNLLAKVVNQDHDDYDHNLRYDTLTFIADGTNRLKNTDKITIDYGYEPYYTVSEMGVDLDYSVRLPSVRTQRTFTYEELKKGIKVAEGQYVAPDNQITMVIKTSNLGTITLYSISLNDGETFEVNDDAKILDCIYDNNYQLGFKYITSHEYTYKDQ